MSFVSKLQKITLKNAVEISHILAKKKSSFFVNPFYLLNNCYFQERDGETLVFQSSIFRKGQHNLIHIPKHTDKLEQQGFTLLFNDEINELQSLGFKIIEKKEIGVEYFFKTADFLELKGKKFSQMRKTINKLKREHDINVFTFYDKNKAELFINEWAKSKNSEKMSEKERHGFDKELKSNLEAISLLDVISNNSYFVEVDHKLGGLAIDVRLNNDLYAGVFLKVNNRIKGLTELITELSCRGYKDTPFFTTGAAGGNEGLAEHNKHMHPCEEKMLYFVLAEKKKIG